MHEPFENFQLHIDTDGLALLQLAVAGHAMNVWTEGFGQELHTALVPYKGWDSTGQGTPDAWGLLNGMVTQQAAQTAAIGALAKALGDAHDDVDTAAVVAAVQEAIAEAVVKVDVSVGDNTTTKE